MAKLCVFALDADGSAAIVGFSLKHVNQIPRYPLL